jgi:heat shock protein HslJ
MSRSGLCIAFAATMTLIACGGDAANTDAPVDTPPEVVAMQPITGDWLITAIETADGTLVPAEGTTPSLSFSEEAMPTGSRIVTGSGGCNRISGGYDAGRTGSLAFTGSPAMTRMACPGPIMDFESALTNALSEVRSYAVEAGVLSISYVGGTIRLESSD